MAVVSNVTVFQKVITCFLSNSYYRKDETSFFPYSREREILEKVAATNHDILIHYLLSNTALHLLLS
jgi:hypothetical protein